MQSLAFSIEEIHSLGVHVDPRTYQLPRALTTETWAPSYTFWFFVEDFEEGPVIDNILYPAAKGYFACCKPMQSMRLTACFRAYTLEISTKDPELIAALNILPSYAYHPEMDNLLEVIKELQNVQTRNTLDARLKLSAYTCSVLRMLLEPHYAIEHTYEPNPRRHQAALLAAKNYLKEHLEQDVDLAKLAKGSHLHPTYFHKLFTAAFGRTPAEQLMRYRILAARSYLRDDNCSIAEVAMKCGFSSQSYFCRKFKESTWMTPSAYRNSLRRKRKK